jgi:hypothetical protein
VRGTGIVGATVEVYQGSRPAGNNRRGLPIAYLGSTVVKPNGNWTLPIAGLSAGDRVTALQIRTDETTSDLAVNVTVVNGGPADTRIAADDFERTSVSGWGDAVVGGAWAQTGAASSYTVSGGAGHMNVATGVTRDALLAVDVPAADLTISGTVSFDKVPVGGAAFAYVDARRSGSTAYRATIREAKTGVIWVQIRKSVSGTETALTTDVSTGVTATASTNLGFRFRLIGGHLQFRVWDASGAEPATWQSEVDDSSITAAGNVALRAFLGTTVTNGPVAISFDNYLANPAP